MPPSLSNYPLGGQKSQDRQTVVPASQACLLPFSSPPAYTSLLQPQHRLEDHPCLSPQPTYPRRPEGKTKTMQGVASLDGPRPRPPLTPIDPNAHGVCWPVQDSTLPQEPQRPPFPGQGPFLQISSWAPRPFSVPTVLSLPLVKAGSLPGKICQACSSVPLLLSPSPVVSHRLSLFYASLYPQQLGWTFPGPSPPFCLPCPSAISAISAPASLHSVPSSRPYGHAVDIICFCSRRRGQAVKDHSSTL